MNWPGSQIPSGSTPPLDDRVLVYLWPDAAPELIAGAHDIFVIAVRTSEGQQRERARQQIREAVRAVLSRRLDIDPACIALPAAQGHAPRIVLDHRAARAGINAAVARDVGHAGDAGDARHAAVTPLDIGISISHESGLSLAAINLRGAIGVDLMRVQDIADWEIVARDYLGPDAARVLNSIPATRRASAFATAWTAREASLKCLGLPLQEWTPLGLPCRQQELLIPDGYAGSIAIPF